MHTIGVLSSGVPNTFRHIAAAVKTGEIPNARISVVICDQPDAPILSAAEELDIPHYYIPRRQNNFEEQARKLLREASVDMVLLIWLFAKSRHNIA